MTVFHSETELIRSFSVSPGAGGDLVGTPCVVLVRDTKHSGQNISMAVFQIVPEGHFFLIS